MKNILKSLLGLALSAAAATAILSVSVFASTAGIDNSSYTLEYKLGMWQGRFPVFNVESFSNEFNEPESFAFRVNGNTATLTGKYPYEQNYKFASVEVKSDAGIKYDHTDNADCNDKVVSASGFYSGTIYYVKNFGYMYEGTTTASAMHEKVGVYVAKNGYMPASDDDEPVMQ